MSSKRGPTLLYEKRAKARGYKVIAGVDESGVGPLAGPLVAAAVIVRDFNFISRIDDSKKLTPKSRLLAYKEIIKKSLYSVSVIEKDIIDRINVYNAARLAMEGAVRGLALKPDYILIDGTIKLSIAYNGKSIKRGDGSSLSIACASIIAKVTRDSIMDGLHSRYPWYGFENNKGYGTAFHISAIKKYGHSPAHRITFNPVKSLTKEQ